MLYLVYIPYLGMIYVICVTKRMQLHCVSRLNPCTSACAPFFNERDERAASVLGERASRERTADPTQDYASRTYHDRMESRGPVHMEPIASEEKSAEVYFLSNGTLKSRMSGRAAFF